MSCFENHFPFITNVIQVSILIIFHANLQDKFPNTRLIQLKGAVRNP
jgi:hypothetical protein